jgi:hypothetical protein
MFGNIVLHYVQAPGNLVYARFLLKEQPQDAESGLLSQSFQRGDAIKASDRQKS